MKNKDKKEQDFNQEDELEPLTQKEMLEIAQDLQEYFDQYEFILPTLDANKFNKEVERKRNQAISNKSIFIPGPSTKQ